MFINVVGIVPPKSSKSNTRYTLSSQKWHPMSSQKCHPELVLLAKKSFAKQRNGEPETKIAKKSEKFKDSKIKGVPELVLLAEKELWVACQWD